MRAPLSPFPPWLSAVALASVTTLPAQAEGFRSPTIGTAGLGTSGGRAVWVDDASALAHNPANLLELKRWEASAEPTFVYHSVEFTSATGQTGRTQEPWKLLPHSFIGGPLKGDWLAGGLGITVPYGLSVDWEPDGPLRYVAPHYTELKTINFNPTLAFKLRDNLWLGAGVSGMWSELRFKQWYPWAALPGVPAGAPDGHVRAKADGLGWGGNLGLTWQIAERHRLALTARTPMDIAYDGDLRVSNVPGSADEIVGDLETKIKYPTIVTAGYGVKFTDTVWAEADVEWIQFSRFESLDLQTSQSLPGLQTSQAQNWRDTFTFGVSGTWEFSPGWRLRLSYQHFQSPVPDYNFTPYIPDSTQNVACLGLGYRTGRHRFDVAYSKVFFEARTIGSNQNPGVVGRYEADIHLMSAAYGLSF
jgi:long-chain fatty acid transport protein